MEKSTVKGEKIFKMEFFITFFMISYDTYIQVLIAKKIRLKN